MKIAFIIIAHKNPNHLLKLVKSIKTQNHDIYIHIDKKNLNIFPRINDVYIEKNPLIVNWGDYTFIDAVNRLLKLSSNYKYDRYVLLSGSDFPIKSNEFIDKFFYRNENEYINLFIMPNNNKSLDRILYYKFNMTSMISKYINSLIRVFHFKRKYPKKYQNFIKYAGTTWWALSHDCVSYVLKFIEYEKDYTNFYKNSSNTDEMFYHTIIGNSPFYRLSKHTLTYAEWIQGEAHPKILSLNKFKNNTPINEDGNFYLFARKFSDNYISE